MKATRAIDRSECGSAADVRWVLENPSLDYAQAKIALDRLVSPSIDADATLGELDRLAKAAEMLVGSDAGTDSKLAALRKLIYESGPWNDYRSFDYDHSNVRGADVRVKLISHYLNTRRGDCVSMPVLVLILAEKLGIDMALVSAPNHIFLRHTDDRGRVINLEATSGANPARDEWLRKTRPMTDRAIASGLYMRTLSRSEGIALMATTVLQALMDGGRYDEAIEVSEVILEHSPHNAIALVNQGSAYFNLLRVRYLDTYRSAFLIPLSLRPDYQWLLQRNHAAFTSAKALGWQPDGWLD